MKLEIELPQYSNDGGFPFKWERGFEISVAVHNGEVAISANAAGLISLARHLLVLASDEVPLGVHIHLDQFNSLEEESSELVIQKLPPSNHL